MTATYEALPTTEDNLEQRFFEFAAAFSVPVDDANRVDLLCGRYPSRGRWMNRYEELDSVWPYLRLVRRAEQDNVPEVALWRRAFHNIDDLRRLSYRELLPHLWDVALREAIVHATVYGFRSLSDVLGSGAFQDQAKKLVDDAAGPWASQATVPGRSLFAMHLPWSGVPAGMIERLGGLGASIKQRMSLLDTEPGFVLRYLRRHEQELPELLTPRQFEELALLLFREEGWEATLTPRTRDGGKDVVAVRYIDGLPVVAYVEAKKHSLRSPVRLGTVKEFVATLAGDQVEQGFMMTTSHFTPDAERWGTTRGRHVAVVEFLDRSRLVARLARRLDGIPRAYRFVRDLASQ